MSSSTAIGLLGVIAGAFATGMWGLISASISRRSARLSIANAISGEINALIEIVEFRQYIPELNQAAKQGNPVILRVQQHYFDTYKSNCDKLGTLPPSVATDIARFYTYAKSFLEDVQSFCADGNPDNTRAYEEMARVLEIALETGRRVVIAVNTLNQKSWIRWL